MTVPLLRYTVLRLALFVASLGVFGLLGVRGVALLLLSALVSLGLSYVLLRRQRDAVATVLAERSRNRLDRRHPGGVDADAATEDAEDEARRAAEQ